MAALHTSYSREQILAIHNPIDYSKMNSWGNGAHVLPLLSPLARNVYEQLSTFQDQRDDFGHVDTVIYFTVTLAKLMKLTPLEEEAAVLAAIGHDSGWDVLPNVNVIWKELATKRHSESPNDRQFANDEMHRLRSCHQERGAERIGPLVADHPFAEQIVAVVLDHDTRRQPAPLIFHAFLDGDWMWRITRTSRIAGTSGAYDRRDPNAVMKRLEAEIKPADFLLTWAYYIARLELAATMCAMKREFDWSGFPDDFEINYKDELNKVAG
jgi:hypothetical protein